MTNKEKANLYFWPELGGKCKEDWVLHHKDPSWRKEDPVRYKQWNIEDLEPMTNEEHKKLHSSGENSPMYGKHHSEESKQKMSEAHNGEKNEMYGRHHTEAAKQKISEARKGKKLPPFSEEHKQKISESRKGEKNPMYGRTGEKNPMFGRTGEKAPVFGRHWWNNGIEQKYQKDCPRRRLG